MTTTHDREFILGRIRVLSLGAGVQSTTVLLMSIAGELDRLDAAVFSDTGWEPRVVYDHLAKLEAAATDAGIPRPSGERREPPTGCTRPRPSFRQHAAPRPQPQRRQGHDPPAMHPAVQARPHQTQGPGAA